MGQYHLTANFDKKEFINPHRFGDGIKLLEFASNANGTMMGLAILLAASNKGGARGGGDLHPWISGHGDYDDGRSLPGDPEYADKLMNHIVGRWAGDRIAIVGDYREKGDVPGFDQECYDLWQGEDGIGWTDISELVVDAIELDFYTYQERHKVYDHGNGYKSSRQNSFGGKKSGTVKLYKNGKIVKVKTKEIV